MLHMGAYLKKIYYAYVLPKEHSSGITIEWRECERLVSGKSSARYKGFASEQEAREWLKSGAVYENKKEKKKLLPRAVYFDAGTGRGMGLVEINVTDVKGTSLLFSLLPQKKITKHGTHLIMQRTATNNYGELLACKYALRIAMKEHIPRVYGDSALVIDYWSKGIIKSARVAVRTVALAKEVHGLRSRFEKSGGVIRRISGGINPADLGFHR